jgi:ribosomal protein L11 methyltransferase
MSYTECRFKLEPFQPYNEIIVTELAELGFESFTESESEVQAYILGDLFTEKVLEQCKQIRYEGVSICLDIIEIEKENWNQKWEESFDPVEIGDFCIIRAPFHEVKSSFKYEINIEPKMSFGTGHHATTQLMVKAMSKLDLTEKTVLDMGSGTGVLAILADFMKARKVDAIDIEDWAYENIKENLERNKTEIVLPFLGDAEFLKRMSVEYDFVLANINKNILLADLEVYDSKLKPGGQILLSGFFTYDANELINFLSKLNYKLLANNSLEDWCCLQFIKK